MCFEHFVKLVWGTAGNGSVKQTFKCVANICSAVTRVTVFFCNFNCCPFLTDQCKSVRRVFESAEDRSCKLWTIECDKNSHGHLLFSDSRCKHCDKSLSATQGGGSGGDQDASSICRHFHLWHRCRFSYCLNWNNRDHFSGAAENLGSPPAYYSNTPSPQEPAAPPPQVKH